jgi:integrase
MAIKHNNKTNTYSVQVQKRCPKRGYSIPLKKKGIKTLIEAKRIEKKLLFELAERINAKVSPTLAKVIEEYSMYRLEIGHANSTVTSYRLSFARFMEDFLDIPINRIQKNDIHVMIQKKFVNNDSYLSYFFKCCRGTFRYAVERDYLASDPTPYRRLKKPEKISTVLSEKEAALLLAKAKEQNSVWYPIWMTALYTGMRTGELYALSWENVDLEQNLIHVRQSWNPRDGFKCTKSGCDRIVQIAPQLKILLKELKILTGGQGFVLPRLRKWEKGEQARELKLFLLGNKMTEVRFHDLRATWATVLLSKGVEPIKVMTMGGWKDLKTMMLYIRKAGIDTKGALDCLQFNKFSDGNAQIIDLNVEKHRAEFAN